MTEEHVVQSSDAVANATAIRTALDNVVSAGGGAVVFSPGVYRVDGPIVVDGSNCDILFVFTNTTLSFTNLVAGDTALTFSTNATSNRWLYIRATQGVLHVRNEGDWDNASTGITVENVMRSSFDTLYVRGFSTGIRLIAQAGKSVGFNRLHIGALEQNKIGAHISADDTAWINENTFIGGRWANGDVDSADTDNHNLLIEKGHENKFIACTFGGDPACSVEMRRSAENNQFVGCRFEPGTAVHLVYSDAQGAVFLGCNFVTRQEDSSYDTPSFAFHTLENATRHVLLGCVGPRFVTSETDIAPVLAAGSIGSCVTPATTGSQLITNSRFEYFDESDPSAPTPLNWMISANLEVARITDASTEADPQPKDKAPLHGESVLRLINTSNHVGTILQTLQLTPGATYTLYVRYRVGSGTNAHVLLGDGGRFFNGSHSIQADEDDKWHVSCYDFTAIADSTDFGFQVPAEATAYIDMVAVQTGLEVPHFYSAPAVTEIGGKMFGDLEMLDASAGIILTSSSGKRYRINVNDGPPPDLVLTEL